MKKFFSEFKIFISRGNVIDLAVGVVVGSAFTAIVNSLVNDIVMPIVGILMGGINFTELKYVIAPAVGDIPEVAICYGSFIQAIINFLLVSLAVFSAIKAINKLHRKKEEVKEAEPEKPSEEVLIMREIRDILKEK